MFKKNRLLVLRLGGILILVGGILGMGTPKPVLASTITVTNTNDSGPGSLRQAIAGAVSGDTIKFSSSLSGQTIILSSQLDITKNLVIDGSGLDPRVSINGNNVVRIFNISNNRVFTLRSLILTNGKMTGLSYTAFGGAMFVNSSTTLTIDNTLITNSSAYSAGAIYLSSAVVATITNSEIKGNEADTEGGAIRVNSTGILNLKNSTVSSNTAYGSGTVYFSGATNSSIIENNLFDNNSALAGGAIIGQLGNARIEIRNNLFSNNHATGAYQAGGAIYFSASTIPTLVILENNTFYNNAAGGVGGGAYLGAAADYYLINNTFSNNMASTGGNLYLDHGAGASRMYNNILANNSGGGDCMAFYNSYINGSNNLVEDGGSECFPTFTGDPELLPLLDNGGPTQTMALSPESSAIDAGNNSFCATTDQRGSLRPQGIACDLGAVELDETPPNLISSEPINGAVLIADTPVPLQITFSEPMNQYFDGGLVNDPSNYLLINDNGDGFQTTSCLNGISTQDQVFTINDVVYDNTTLMASLRINDGAVLPVGNYQLFVCGTTPAITDIAGNPINDSLSDDIVAFRVIAISGDSVSENMPAGTSVFILTAPTGGNFSYSLEENISGCNGADNSSFSFNSNQLLTTGSFDYETKNAYMICVRINEVGGNSFNQGLNIRVTDVNEFPTDIGLSKATVYENLSVAAQVGILYTLDPDANSTFVYDLVEDVSGCNSVDNSSFTIVGNILRTNEVFDYETKASYSICIRSTDNGSLSVAKEFIINILNTNDAPGNIILTPSSVLENQLGNTLVGYLIAIDPDGPTTTSFSSIPGRENCSSTGFNWFVLANGNEIRTLAPLDYNVASNYTLCIRATDSLGAVFDKQLTVTVISASYPTVSSITRTDTDPTNAAIVDFTVTFTKAVIGVTVDDFDLYTTGITGAAVTNASGSGDTYVVTVNTGSGDGTIRLDVLDNNSIIDGASNPLGGITVGDGDFINGEVYTITKSRTFGDVPNTHPYFQYIEILYANGYTGGCSVTPLNFCPDVSMSRAQSAVFMLRGNFGNTYVPMTPTHFFKDNWKNSSWGEGWAESMYLEGLTAGCSPSPLKFCPDEILTNVQAAVFGLRLKHGMTYPTPTATGTVFADMTDTGFWGTGWAEQAYAEGLIPSCGTDVGTGKPKFCPNALVSRGFGAYVIVTAKNLTMP